MIQFLTCGALAILFAYQSQFKRNRYLLVFSFVIIAYIMGMQDAISTDFNNYKEIFNDIIAGKIGHSYLGFNTKEGFEGIESGWYYLNLAVGSIINSYNVVATIAAGIMSFALYKIVNFSCLKYRWLAVGFFYFIPMLFLMSAIRQGVAVGLFILVVLYVIERSWKKAILCVMLGLAFHNSFIFSILFLPILFIPEDFINKHKKTITILLIVSYTLTVIFSAQINQFAINYAIENIGNEMSSYEGYFKEALRGKLSTIYILFRYILFCISLVAFWNSSSNDRKFILLYIISSFTIAIMGENNNMSRLNYYISIFAIPCMCLVPLYLKNNILKYVFLILISYYIFNSFTKAMDTVYYSRFLEYKTIIF